MPNKLAVGWIAALLFACSSAGDGEPDLFFAIDDTIHLPGGDGRSSTPDDTVAGTQDGDGTSVPGDETVAPIDGCSPDCENKTCGDDGCGGSCGQCPEGYTCDNNHICTHDICQPACAGKACGDDGCGGQCGTCPNGFDCVGGACVDDCTPDCFGKDCGTDGCGGSCGQCGGGLYCVEGKCTCLPDCGGKVCGSDGCGGSCGTCVAPESCSGAGQCENLSCQVQGALTCNTSIAGETSGLANGFGSYGCGFDASGPEALYSFTSDSETFVFVELEEPGVSKHNVYVIHGDCNPNVCVTNDFDTVYWTAEPGESYIYSVDGYQGASGSFTAHVTCIESGGCPSGKIPGCNEGQCQYGHWLGDGMCTKEFECEAYDFDKGDCD